MSIANDNENSKPIFILADKDSLENNGFNAGRSFFDFHAFVKSMPRVVRGIAFQNREFLPIQETLCENVDIKCRSTGVNADDAIVAAAVEALNTGYKKILLLTGDGDLSVRVWSLVSQAGAELQVACRSHNFSATIQQYSDGPAFILDRFVTKPAFSSGKQLVRSAHRRLGLKAPHLSIRQQPMEAFAM